MNEKIKNFTDLIVWQRGHKLVLSIYDITEKFPKKEIFGLSNQLRRASVSFTSNTAEGFGRGTINDKTHFYTMALGSLYEIQSQLLIAKDLVYVEKEKFDKLFNESIEISKMCSVLIKKIKN